MQKLRGQYRPTRPSFLRALALASALVAPGAALADTSMAIPGDAGLARAGATLVGETAGSRAMALAIVLPSRDPAGADAFATRVSTPGDALYRHYFSPAEYAARFGASASDYEAVRAWAVSQGLTPGEVYAARTVLPLHGTAAAVSAAFGVHFSDFRNAQGRTFYAADSDAHMPAAFAGRVTGVLGLSSASHFAPLARIKPAGVKTLEEGSGPDGGFLAADLRKIYSVPPQPFTTHTQTLAVFEQGGFDPADVATYVTRNKLPTIPVVPRLVNGYGGGIDDPNVEFEAVLDIDMQMGINPSAKKILVYEDGLADSFQVSLLNSISAMASDDEAQTISISYGQDERLQGVPAVFAENTVFTQMVAQGQSVFVSSGDGGAYGDESQGLLNVADPASQPRLTSVGGTTLFTLGKNKYFAENTYNDLGIGYGATGGGISTIWTLPTYQKSAFTTSNGGSSTYRNVPDVAAVGSLLTGVAIYSKINGGWLISGGTSVSAPIWAGLYSLVNAATEGLGFGSAGFANPALYKVASSFGLFYPDLNDVVDGTNGNSALFGVAGYSAGYGYDNATGLGSFQGTNLVAEIALLPTRKNSNPPPAPTGVKATATPTSVTLSWVAPPAGVAGYLIYGFSESTFATVATILQKKTSVTVSGLAPNATYEFQVLSITAGGLTSAAPVIIGTPKA